ncbi:MAG: AAA family ATPase, partial [Proteobacteria bacterium]|nr:AAA family ATPase [Pseudomonadota bacterium]
HDVIGEVPDRAATLQMAAEPGTIVIDARTRSLVGDLFECHDLDPVEPASSIRPVRRWRVARERSPESRFSALRGPQSSPLLGRDEELQLLLRRWARCEAGEGHTVLISGEPGIGKSRLAAALEEHLRDRPHRVIHFACSPDHQDSALYPFTANPDAIADFRHHDVTPNQTSPEQTEPRHAMDGHKAPPQISRPPSSPVSDSVRPAGSRARPGRERTLETLARQIEASARRQPMLLLFEDVHWIDPTSRELLDLIIPRFHELPILMLVTFRPEFRPDWMGRPHVTVLTLNRLSTKDGLELARLVAGPANLSPRLFEQISKQADGIPLFVEELTKSVLEDEARARRSRLTIPPNLYASLMARLDRLGPVARQVAQAGAAIGQDFSYRLLHAVYPAPDHEMAACLDSLVAAGLLFRRGEPPDAVYSFKHALLRDAAYDSLLREHRRRLHAAIAKALEAQSPERLESEPEVIALHYSEAGLPQSAADYWAKAGRRFVAQSAMAEAAAHFQRALAQLALIPSTLARERQELELTIALAASSQTAKGLAAPETGQAFTHAMKLWEQLGCPVEYSRAPLGLSGYHTNRGDLEVAEGLNADFLRLANGRGEPSLLCTAHAIAGRTLTFTGRFSEAREHLESAGKIYDQIPQQRSFSQYGLTPRTAADGYLALVLFCTGSPDRALAKVRDTTAYAYDVAHVPSMTLAHVFGATLFSLAGDDQALDDEVRSLLDLADEHEFLLYKAQGTIFLGWSNV